MRKFLVAAVVGLALAAGGAAAQESAVNNLGNPIGPINGRWTSTDTLSAALIGVGFAGILYLCLSERGNKGAPASP